MKKLFKDKRILVTGSCGTVGSELIDQLLTCEDYDIKEIVGIDSNESQLFFQDQKYLSEARASFFVADIRDRNELINKMSGIDIVFHAAALKHVILSERSPEQAVLTNIKGVENVIRAAKSNNVESVIFTSSDKAVNPTNVMGTTKLMGERLMTAANSNKREHGPIFTSTRFGNVLGSNGSVVQIFKQQIATGGPVTLTDKNMTRFVMSVQEAVYLVIDSALQAKGGEVFVTKMPVMRIEDLAQAMVEVLAPKYGYTKDQIEIVEVGVKPGEKIYEELLSSEETGRSVELKKYFSVLPAFRGLYTDINYEYDDVCNTNIDDPYISEKISALSVDEIKSFLESNNLFD